MEGTAQAGAGRGIALGALVPLVPEEKKVSLQSQPGEGLRIKKKVRAFLRSLSKKEGLLAGVLTTGWHWAMHSSHDIPQRQMPLYPPL